MIAGASPAYDALFGDEPYVHMKKPKRAGELYQKPSHRAPRSPVKSSDLSASQRLGNMAGRKQAMVKVIRNGGVKSKGQLGKQLAYISREGAIEGRLSENGFEQAWRGGGQVGDVVLAWENDFAEMARKGVTNKTYHLVVSYPVGTDPERAKMAGEMFAAGFGDGTFGDVYRYVAVQHTDTSSPHTHVVINRLGESGSCLHISNYALTVQQLREHQVETAAAFGLDMNATPRATRAGTRAPSSIARLKADGEGRAIKNRALDADLSEIRFESFEKPRWEGMIKALKTCQEMFDTRESKALLAFVKLSIETQLSVGDRRMSQETISDNANQAQEMLKRQQIAISRTLAEAEKRVSGFPEGPARERAGLAFEEVRSQLAPLLSGEEYDRWRGGASSENEHAIPARAEAVRAVEDVDYVSELMARNSNSEGRKDGELPIVALPPELDQKVRANEPLEKDQPIASRQDQGELPGKVAQSRLSSADADVARLAEKHGLNGAKFVRSLETLEGAGRKDRLGWEKLQTKEIMASTGVTERTAKKKISELNKGASNIYNDATKDIRRIKPEVLLSRDNIEGREESRGAATKGERVNATDAKSNTAPKATRVHKPEERER